MTARTSGSKLRKGTNSAQAFSHSRMIAGYLAQGLDAYEAACLAVYLHGAAGESLREEMGEAGLLAGEAFGAVAAQESADPVSAGQGGELGTFALTDLSPTIQEALADVQPFQHIQFERLGYYCADPELAGVFHRTVGLRDDWAKIRKRQGQK